MIQTVLADDEVLARQKLRQLLREEQDIEIVGESGSAAETVQLIRVAKPELLFLDVRMPGMDGFDVVGALSCDRSFLMPSVIFTTAYDQYALRAFEIHAVDYLLKPFTQERLRSAIQRVRERYASRDHLEQHVNGKTHDVSPFMTRIVFKSRGRIVFLPISEIRWIGAEENYVRLCTEKETHLLREPISKLEERLDPASFLRVHRSFIVNLQFVKEVRSDQGGESAVVMANGQRISMSRSYKSRILECLHR